VRGGGVEVAAHVKDEPAAVEVECLNEEMVNDASRLAGSRLAEDHDVLSCIAQVEGDVRAALEAGGVPECGKRAGRLTDPEAEVARLAEVRPDGRRCIDRLAQRQCRERFAVEHTH